MRELIAVGDILVNSDGESCTLSTVERGKHGLLVKGILSKYQFTFTGFLPFELPPCEDTRDWYGWGARDHVVLLDKTQLGLVGFLRSDPRPRIIEEYDAEWERTLEAWQPEEMQSRPLPKAENVMGAG